MEGMAEPVEAQEALPAGEEGTREGVGEERREKRPPHPPHQAVLFLPGVLREGLFHAERLPRGVPVALGGKALKDPQGEAGEGVFALWPRTDEGGRILSLQVASRLREPYEGPQAVVQGVLLYADRERLVLLILPKGGEGFKVGLKRARGFAARLEPKKAYRVEGRLGGPYLLAERAWPLGKYLQAKKEGQPLPPPIQGRENPYLEPREGRPKEGAEGGGEGEARKGEGAREEAKARREPPPRPKEAPKGKGLGGKPLPRRDPVRVWRAPEEPPDPAPPDLGRPPALGKGQVMGLAGTGPYYLVLLPQAVPEWWPRVERLLPEFPRRYEVRFYPDGSRAVVSGDLEALKVWYKRVLRG
ncbi:hypothetical protein [Thermus aquaticus]|uniref:Uncharacterized protein n=1 Tax=Thermus aquaticus (strain ATCC BAA-2747 / Y51MC23) TaxID=498848 RepID=A0ABM5VR99_THEA5|nr:hypothetical protein [Thermus aquaticus]ALJ92229.1 hypothetical protein TO73_2520 [Thermus aquaticus Y51MC23]